MRLLFLALFMTLATHVWAQDAQGVTPESPSVQEQPNGSADGTSGDEWRGALPVKIIESADEAADRRDREKKSDQHEADDLAAQRKAADAAESGAAAANGQIIPTWIQAAVAIVGTLALLYTLRLTRRSIQDNRKIGQATVRAYLTVKPMSRHYAPWRAELALANTGQSPARNVRHVSAFGYLPWPLSPGQNDLLIINGREAKPTLMIGASTDVTIEADYIEPIGDDGGVLCVFGTIFYEDVFGAEYKLRFCSKWISAEQSTIGGVALERHIWEQSNFHNDEVEVIAPKSWWSRT